MSELRYETSAGRVGVTFGINDWVVVEDRSGGRVQRQVKTPAQLGELLREGGIPFEEAHELAPRVWAERPADAGTTDAAGGESPWRAAGMSATAVGLLVLAIAFVVFFLVYSAGKDGF